MISWFSIGFLFLVFVAYAWWHSHARAREGSIAAVKNACKRNNFQLLDGSVSLKKVRIKKSFATSGGEDFNNSLSYCLLWIFCFEYYDGESRCLGLVSWNCGKLQKIEFVAGADVSNKNIKVVNLDDFRKQ
jgi:hypothetical protein